jgi:hypothetical protein
VIKGFKVILHMKINTLNVEKMETLKSGRRAQLELLR